MIGRAITPQDLPTASPMVCDSCYVRGLLGDIRRSTAACLWAPNANIEGAPARNHSAIAASQIMHPNDDVGMKGQIGLPQRWWTMSKQECISHASPIHR
jgi:hypothetical protein